MKACSVAKATPPKGATEFEKLENELAVCTICNHEADHLDKACYNKPSDVSCEENHADGTHAACVSNFLDHACSGVSPKPGFAADKTGLNKNCAAACIVKYMLDLSATFDSCFCNAASKGCLVGWDTCTACHQACIQRALNQDARCVGQIDLLEKMDQETKANVVAQAVNSSALSDVDASLAKAAADAFVGNAPSPSPGQTSSAFVAEATTNPTSTVLTKIGLAMCDGAANGNGPHTCGGYTDIEIVVNGVQGYTRSTEPQVCPVPSPTPAPAPTGGSAPTRTPTPAPSPIATTTIPF